MSWKYQIMRRKVGKEYVYGIYEVFSSPKGWTEECVGPQGETLEELRRDYEAMGEAFRLPVLDHKTGRRVKP